MQKTVAMTAERPLLSRREIVIGCLLAVLVAAVAHLRIPIYGSPVPLTLQTLFVLIAGGMLRPAVAAGSMALFVTTGLAGAPVFSGGGAGLAYMLGSTGGYLIGFVAGAAVCSFVLNGRRDSMGRIVVSMIAATATIFLFGWFQLGALLGDFISAYLLGVQPFLLGAGLKIVIAASVVSGYATLAAKN